MRIAVIGAGIVGVTTAQALHEDGHQVVVLERQGSVATETSFANAGVLAPGYVTPWAAPGMWRKVMAQWFERDAAVRLASLPGPALLGWLWRWWRACDSGTYARNRAAMLALARDSLARLQPLAKVHGIDHERGRGLLVLLRGEPELAQTRTSLKMLAELDVNFHLVSAERCRAIEPALEPATELKAGIHLPDAEVGNCRQFALQLKAALQKVGVEFRFHQEVNRIEPGQSLTLHCTERAGDAQTSLGITPENASAPAQTSDRFDAVVVCAALGSVGLLSPLRLPMQAVHGYSITLPVQHFEAYPDLGPRAALMDERFKVAISRLGDRVRVAGSAELGGQAQNLRAAPLATLYRVLQDWFPSAARQSGAQTWKGARPMLPDGPPAIGASPTPGVWINSGHGSSGWALACGSARLMADLIGGRAPAVDPAPFSPLRWS